MSVFDKLAGLNEGYTRRPLKTLREAGGDVKSTTDATMDYGNPPREFVHGSPNSAYRSKKDAMFGDSSAPSPSAAALRTGK